MPYQPYRLIKTERHFAERGEVPPDSSWRPSQLEDNVVEKVELLPQRFETLLDDIELLYENGYLGPEHFGDALLELFEIKEDDDLASQFTYSVTGRQLKNSGSVEFGRKLGRMVSQLLLFPTGLERDEVRADVVWGFMEGIGGYRAPEDGSFTAKCTERHQRRIKRKAEHKPPVEDIKQLRERLTKQRERERNQIREILNARGVEPTNLIIDRVRHDLFDREGMNSPVRRMAGMDTLEEGDTTPERVGEILKKGRWEEKQAAMNYLQDGAEIFESTTWDSTAAIEVLTEIPEGKNTCRQIAEGMDPNATTVAKLGLFLSAEAEIDGEKWDGPPATRVSRSDGRSPARWVLETKAFGEAITRYAKAGETMRAMGPFYCVGDSLVEKMLNELDSETGEGNTHL